jgi:cytochrome c oxidase subunit 3
MFLATVAMLFAAFTSAYIVRRSGSDWRAVTLPSALWLNTVVLLASSAALEIARWRLRQARQTAALGSLAGGVLLGAMFLAGQFRVWRGLVEAGVYLPTSPHASFFFILTGIHAIHLGAGLVFLVAVIARMHRDLAAPGPWAMAAHRARHAYFAGLAATFWHFFAGAWLYLFAILSCF